MVNIIFDIDHLSIVENFLCKNWPAKGLDLYICIFCKFCQYYHKSSEYLINSDYIFRSMCIHSKLMPQKS